MNNAINRYLPDFTRAKNTNSLNGYDLGLVGTLDIVYKSSDNNIKDYYLEFPNGDIDTLFVDFRRLTSCEANISACKCLFPLNAVKYNGRTATLDSSLIAYKVYLFNKQ